MIIFVKMVLLIMITIKLILEIILMIILIQKIDKSNNLGAVENNRFEMKQNRRFCKKEQITIKKISLIWRPGLNIIN